VIGDSNVVIESTAAPPNFYKSRKRKADPVEEEMLKILKQDETDDPDRSFFLSLQGDFCKLPQHNKMPTKLASSATYVHTTT